MEENGKYEGYEVIKINDKKYKIYRFGCPQEFEDSQNEDSNQKLFWKTGQGHFVGGERVLLPEILERWPKGQPNPKGGQRVGGDSIGFNKRDIQKGKGNHKRG